MYFIKSHPPKSPTFTWWDKWAHLHPTALSWHFGDSLFFKLGHDDCGTVRVCHLTTVTTDVYILSVRANQFWVCLQKLLPLFLDGVDGRE